MHNEELQRREGTSGKSEAPLESIISPVLSQSIETSQIAKYHTKGGHGFTAEDVNHFFDRIRGYSAEIVGKTNE